MRPRQFEDSLLLQKKARFLEAVRRAARHLGVDEPEVFFGDCSDRGRNQLAHIHLYQRLICVSDEQLKVQSYDDIENTATHEVTHLSDTHDESNPIHSPDFYRRHDALKVAAWRPPAGVGIVMLDPRLKRPLRKKRRKTIDKPDLERCNYHFCRRKTQLYKCDYCGDYYCDEHLNAKEPFMTDFGSLHGLAQIRYRDTRGHPCGVYSHEVMCNEQEAKKRYQDALRRAATNKGSKNIYHGYSRDETQREQPRPKPKAEQSTPQGQEQHPESSSGITLRVHTRKYFLFKVKKLLVTLVKNNQYVTSDYTNEEGIVAFRNLKPGEYIIVISCKQQNREHPITLANELHEVRINV